MTLYKYLNPPNCEISNNVTPRKVGCSLKSMMNGIQMEYRT